MAHEIMEHDVVEGRTQAWHGLSRVNVDLAIANCWLGTWDYQINPILLNGKKSPFAWLGCTDAPEVSLLDEDGNPTGEMTPLAIGQPFQVKSFKPVMNAQLLPRLATALEGLNIPLTSAGTVKNRARLFLSFEILEAKFQAAGRPFEAFLNIGNSQDKSSPFWINTSNICTVCNNTFQLNMLDAGMIMSIKKTKNSDLQISNLGKAIKSVLSGQKEFARQLTHLSKLECEKPMAEAFFAGFVGTADAPLSTRSLGIVEQLVLLFEKGAGNDGNDFSDVFQAGTDFYTHLSASGAGSQAAAWKNFESSEFGAGRNAKTDMFNILLEDKSRKGMVALGKKILKLTDAARREEEKAK